MQPFNPLTDLPMGLGMALCQNPGAMEYFASLSPDEQRRVIDGAHTVGSSAEMKAYLNHITSELPPPL